MKTTTGPVVSRRRGSPRIAGFSYRFEPSQEIRRLHQNLPRGSDTAEDAPALIMLSVSQQ
jgi:hypothetical protein